MDYLSKKKPHHAVYNRVLSLPEQVGVLLLGVNSPVKALFNRNRARTPDV